MGSLEWGPAHVYNGTISATYVFGANLLMDAYFRYSRNNIYSKQSYKDQNLGWTLLGISGLNTLWNWIRSRQLGITRKADAF